VERAAGGDEEGGGGGSGVVWKDGGGGGVEEGVPRSRWFHGACGWQQPPSWTQRRAPPPAAAPHFNYSCNEKSVAKVVAPCTFACSGLLDVRVDEPALVVMQ